MQTGNEDIQAPQVCGVAEIITFQIGPQSQHPAQGTFWCQEPLHGDTYHSWYASHFTVVYPWWVVAPAPDSTCAQTPTGALE